MLTAPSARVLAPNPAAARVSPLASLASIASLVMVGLCAALSAVCPAVAHADARQSEPERIGLGLGGSWWSFGFAGRYNLSAQSFLQGTLGSVNSRDNAGAGLSLDYMRRGKTLTSNSDAALNLNYGGGVLLGGGESVGPIFGLAPGVALEVDLVEVPIDLSLEYRPVLFVLPEPDFALMGLGVRFHYWF